MPDGREVHAYLVRAPRDRMRLHERAPAERAVEAFDDPIVCKSSASSLDDGHLLALLRVPADGRVYLPLGVPYRPCRQRDVRLVDAALLHLAREAPVGRVRLRDDDEAGRVLVQPVHDAGALHAADARQVRHERQQRVHERAVRVPRRGVHREPRGLVHHDELIVLVDDADGDVLRREVERRRRRHDDHDHVAAAHGSRRLHGAPVDGDAALARERGCPRSAERRIPRLHERVHAGAGVGLACGEPRFPRLRSLLPRWGKVRMGVDRRG